MSIAHTYLIHHTIQITALDQLYKYIFYYKSILSDMVLFSSTVILLSSFVS